MTATETTKYRVLYYTMQGIRSRDFDHIGEAMKFKECHIAKHPEYQNSCFSKTELVVLEPITSVETRTDTYTAEAYQVPDFVALLAQDIYTKRNTTQGARMYFALESLVEAIGCDDALLYDLAADFNWDFDWEAQRATL